MERLKRVVKSLFVIGTMSFLGGLLGGFLGVGLLDGFLFDKNASREVILQESSVIIDVAEKLAPSVVSIEVEATPSVDIFGREFERRGGAGTGIIVSEDGIILTNRHVVPEDGSITVITHEGTVHENVAVIDRDPFNDIAYLQLDTEEELHPAEIGDSDQVVVGQRVIAIGNALGEFTNTVTSGIVSGIGRPITARSGPFETERLQGLFQTDAAINPGNSGGPLANIEGQVIGLNTAVAGNAENIGFAIPINQATAGLISIQEHGRLIKPFMGVRYVMLTEEIAEDAGLEVSAGAYLPETGEESSVMPASPADQAGIRPGDVITAIDGEEITLSNPLALVMNRFQVGDEVTVEIWRGGNTLSVTVELEELPEDL